VRRRKEDRVALEVGVGSVYVLCVGVTLVSIGWLRRFLAETSGIVDTASLERFRRLARTEMYVKVGVGVLLAGGFLGCLALIPRGGPVGLVTLVLGNLAVYGVGLWHRHFEARARNLSAASDALRDEYGRASIAWAKRLIPNF
jgi:hypothetical protein